MTDAGLKIELDAELADQLRAVAAAYDLSVEDYVRMALSADAQRAAEALAFDDDEALKEDLAALEEFDRTGVGVPWEEVKAWMRSWGSENELPRPKPRKLK